MKLYDELARWFPLLTAPADYEEEARFYHRVLSEHCATPPRAVLELGSGGGNNASHLKAHWDLTLVDLSEPMLEVSRALNPECTHVQGDMRTVRLERTFDAVFVHDAVSYILTEDDLRATMQTVYEHLLPGGAALFAPDDTVENFRPATEHGGHDGDGRGLRYLQWSLPPDSRGRYFTHFAYLLREGDRVWAEHDVHEFAAFPAATWLQLLTDVGFEAVTHVPVEHSELEPDECEVFAARRPAP